MVTVETYRAAIGNLQTYNVDKVVKGSFHQGDARFGDTAGSQCMCNALWAICYSVIKGTQYLTECNLDVILILANDVYVSLGYILVCYGL